MVAPELHVHRNRKSLASIAAPLHERDDVVRGAAVEVDLPVRRVDVGEARTRAVADEAQRIARRRAVAGEVHDGVAVGLPDVEHEGVVAGVAGEDVGSALTVERVVAGIAEDAVGERVADAVEIGAALQHQRLDVAGKREVDRGEDGVVALRRRSRPPHRWRCRRSRCRCRARRSWCRRQLCRR